MGWVGGQEARGKRRGNTVNCGRGGTEREGVIQLSCGH